MWRRWLALCLCAFAMAGAGAVAIEPPVAQVIATGGDAPPADNDPRWQPVPLPDTQAGPVAWYRIAFERRAVPGDDAWMLYLPYLYGGGRVWLNGEPIGAVLESDATRRVRWERPLLLALPPSLLRDGANVLYVRAATAHAPSLTMLPQVVVGTQDTLQAQFDRRLFFVRTVPVITVVVALAAGLFTLIVWSRRRHERLYGLAGLIAVAWGLRTTTFVFDVMPAEWWSAWRLLYHASNGGFIVGLALFALNLAGWWRRPVVLALVAFWAVGPLAYLVFGTAAETFVGRWWVAGMIPVGIGAASIAVVAAVRRPRAGVVMIAVAMVIALVCGVHDYLIAWRSPLIEALLPRWSGHRFFLLHHGANLLLLTLGLLMTLRFVRSLRDAEEANRTLEARVAEREREIAASYAQIAALQQEQATTDERQRIMRDLHDGLGSTLFTSLSRAERGALPPAEMADALRRSIDEMRMAIEALASDEQDFRTAFGNFRFRWDARLREAGILPIWAVDVPDAVLRLPPHDALQVLRIAQEALTNVIKHARASQVTVRLRQQDGHLRFEVEDDGCGAPATAASPGGRGQANMRARAERLGARLSLGPGERGFRVQLDLALG